MYYKQKESQNEKPPALSVHRSLAARFNDITPDKRERIFMQLLAWRAYSAFAAVNSGMAEILNVYNHSFKRYQ